MTDTTKPCPFCGGTQIEFMDAGPMCTMQCAGCEAQGPWVEPTGDQWETLAEQIAMARAAWERRV